MTREETIRKTLDTVLWTRNASDDNKNILTDALIKVLDQEPIIDKIRVEIKAYADHTKDEKQVIAFKSCLNVIDYYMRADKSEEDGNE